MNFIDKAFENNLKGDDFLQAMALEEYDENYDTLCDKLAINNDYDNFWDLVRNYIDTSLQD